MPRCSCLTFTACATLIASIAHARVEGAHNSRRAWRIRAGVMLSAAALVLGSCSQDPAERLYLDALRGEEQGMTREAQIAKIDSAIATAPDRPHYWETRAIYRIDLRDFERAAADIDHAIQLQDRPYLQFLRGLVACQSGHHDQSLDAFDRAIAGQPDNTQFYRGRSLALTVTGNPSGGLADAEHLVATVPQQAESYYARGMALAALGRDSAAIVDFSESLRRRPELIYPLAARSGAYERVGDLPAARADREAVAKALKEGTMCGPCLDPFRY